MLVQTQNLVLGWNPDPGTGMEPRPLDGTPDPWMEPQTLLVGLELQTLGVDPRTLGLVTWAACSSSSWMTRFSSPDRHIVFSPRWVTVKRSQLIGCCFLGQNAQGSASPSCREGRVSC